jgi:hypothetical protein
MHCRINCVKKFNEQDLSSIAITDSDCEAVDVDPQIFRNGGAYEGVGTVEDILLEMRGTTVGLLVLCSVYKHHKAEQSEREVNEAVQETAQSAGAAMSMAGGISVRVVEKEEGEMSLVKKIRKKTCEIF